MSRTHVLGFAKLEDAQAMAAYYSADYKVLIIGPTDQVMVARDNKDGVVWRSGPDADVHLLVATKDTITGPQPAGAGQ
jgi:hypothetical protein